MSAIPDLPDMRAVNASFEYDRQYEFAAPPLTETFTSTTRFGHSSNFAYLFGTDEEQESYIAGLAWLGILVACLFAFWLLLIMIFCILGSKRVGFLSGKPFQRTFFYVNNGQNVNDSYTSEKFNTTPKASASLSGGGNQSDDDDEIYIENESSFATPLGLSTPVQKSQNNQNRSALEESPNKSMQQQKTKISGGRKCCGIDQPVWMRSIFILSGLIFITFAILLVTQGLTNLQGSVDTLAQSSQAAANLTGSGAAMIDDEVIKIQNDAAALRTTLMNELNETNFCPGSPIDISDSSEVAYVREQASVLLTYLDQIGDYAEALNLESLSSTLKANSKSAQDIHDVADKIELTDWQSLIVLIPCTIIPSFLIAAAIMASYDINYPAYHSFIIWIVFPIFFLMVIVGAASSAALIMMTTANADFCYPEQYTVDPNSVVNISQSRFELFINSPDVSVLNIAQKAGYSIGTEEYRVLSFYVTQCSLANPFSDFLQYIPELGNGLDALDTLVTQFNNSNIATQLSAFCNRDFDGLDDSLVQMVSLVTTLVRAVGDALQLIQCDNIVPIYQQAVYDGSCVYSMKAVMWVFCASIVCSFFGFLMITFRSSYSETVYTYTYDNGYGRSSAFHDENDAPTPNSIRNSHVENDTMTRAGQTTNGDSVMQSVVNYENNYLSESNKR